MLFKILHGDDSNISIDITPFHEGYCYVTHGGYMYIDMNIGTKEAPNNQRIKLNAQNCETLMGVSLEELKNEIITQDTVILHEAQAYTDAAIEELSEKIGEGGGSSAPSLIGTWTVVDEPEIPTSDLPLSFTSNGTEYMAIGTTSMGSSSWGINALSYQAKNGGYYDAAYTSNPSGSYGITHGWSNEAYKILTVTEEPTDANAIAWLGANTDAPKIEITPSLPPCDSSNEGQFLRVVNGTPTWSYVPNAENYTF